MNMVQRMHAKVSQTCSLIRCLVAFSVFILMNGASTQRLKTGPMLYLEKFSLPFCDVIMGSILYFLDFCLFSLDF